MPEKQDRSIGELFAELASETGLLIRQEVALAKIELTKKANRVAHSLVAHSSLPRTRKLSTSRAAKVLAR
jgi:hypothetical protein